MSVAVFLKWPTTTTTISAVKLMMGIRLSWYFVAFVVHFEIFSIYPLRDVRTFCKRLECKGSD